MFVGHRQTRLSRLVGIPTPLLTAELLQYYSHQGLTANGTCQYHKNHEPHRGRLAIRLGRA
eukprot:189990-Rhodomonas_salina.1